MVIACCYECEYRVWIGSVVFNGKKRRERERERRGQFRPAVRLDQIRWDRRACRHCSITASTWSKHLLS